MESRPSRPPGVRRALDVTRIVAWNVAVLCALLVAIEGAASWVLLVRDLALKRQYVAERRYTTYDPELGWINVANVYIRDMYGPGVWLRTNRQRFRNDKDFDKAVPAGKQRVIVSGDSFAFGFGVDNDHTWCQRLASLDPKLEVVNMGQGGYGFDQAYLWYKRDGVALNHHAHVMAFISEDFDRMQSDTFVGYGKPVLDVDHDSLVVRNVPVPHAPYSVRFPALRLDDLRNLRIVDLLGRLQHALWPARSQRASFSTTWSDAKMDEVLHRILEDLKHLNAAHASTLVLVHLPRRVEIPSERLPPSVEKVVKLARDLGIPVIDLAGDFHALSPEEIDGMFIKEGQVDYLGAAGHLNERGNAFVANIVHAQLAKLLSSSPASIQ
ncbi:MAG: hypothetical protein HY047_05410 [Acidobacteria bacterium]|nr:hypothetical protein [Acidobacteriota bacterium]